jgi:hypothetical protein
MARSLRSPPAERSNEVFVAARPGPARRAALDADDRYWQTK